MYSHHHDKMRQFTRKVIFRRIAEWFWSLLLALNAKTVEEEGQERGAYLRALLQTVTGDVSEWKRNDLYEYIFGNGNEDVGIIAKLEQFRQEFQNKKEPVLRYKNIAQADKTKKFLSGFAKFLRSHCAFVIGNWNAHETPQGSLPTPKVRQIARVFRER